MTLLLSERNGGFDPGDSVDRITPQRPIVFEQLPLAVMTGEQPQRHTHVFAGSSRHPLGV